MYALDELVDGVLATAARLHRDGEAPLMVGNLSRRGGGDIHCSRSHNSGRDVDFGLYTRDTRSGRAVPSRYYRFDRDGRSLEANGRYEFDVPRNWELLRSLVTAPEFRVQWLVLNPHLEALLLEHARRIGEPRWLIEYVDTVTELPSYANLHRNHLHVRIQCPDGHPRCIEAGPRRKPAEPPTPRRVAGPAVDAPPEQT